MIKNREMYRTSLFCPYVAGELDVGDETGEADWTLNDTLLLARLTSWYIYYTGDFFSRLSGMCPLVLTCHA
jgi:hypothetical protein